MFVAIPPPEYLIGLSHLRRPISLYSPHKTLRLGGAFKTSFSFGTISESTSLHVSSRLFRINIDSVRKQFGRLDTHSPSAEYVTGDRFSPEFMEKRRLEWVLDLLFTLTCSCGSGFIGSYNGYRGTRRCNGAHY